MQRKLSNFVNNYSIWTSQHRLNATSVSASPSFSWPFLITAFLNTIWSRICFSQAAAFNHCSHCLSVPHKSLWVYSFAETQELNWLLLQGRSSSQLVLLWTCSPCTTRRNWRVSVRPGTLGISCLSHLVRGTNGKFLKAQQMLACFCFCILCWSTIEFSQDSHQTLHCFIQIQSTSISEILWPTTSVSWISTPGRCFHRQCWAWSSHTFLVGVIINSFIYSYSFNFICIVYFAAGT